MIINGVHVEADELAALESSATLPGVVPGRVLHIDADALAYKVSSHEVPLYNMMDTAVQDVQRLQALAGAEDYVLHTTPAGSNKGHRAEQALLKEYQGNRAGKQKPALLEDVREFLQNELNGHAHYTAEADDGMASAQYSMVQAGKGNLSVITSPDKDLCMVPGLHMNWRTGCIYGSCDDHFGYVNLDSGGSSKKCVGYGTKFFWAQMLMGDTADNIAGLPLVAGCEMNILKPTKKIAEAYRVLNSTEDPCKISKAMAVLSSRGPAKCGPALAWLILDDLRTDAECYAAVSKLYKLCANLHPETMQNYRTGECVTAKEAFISNARLLWMRRRLNNDDDVIDWLKEVTGRKKGDT